MDFDALRAMRGPEAGAALAAGLTSTHADVRFWAAICIGEGALQDHYWGLAFVPDLINAANLTGDRHHTRAPAVRGESRQAGLFHLKSLPRPTRARGATRRWFRPICAAKIEIVVKQPSHAAKKPSSRSDHLSLPMMTLIPEVCMEEPQHTIFPRSSRRVVPALGQRVRVLRGAHLGIQLGTINRISC
jgi:hypothetical protein